MNISHSRKYKINLSTSSDLEFIFSIFDAAIEYQQRNGFELWPQFSRQMILDEIQENRNWKVLDGNTIVCVFSVQYNDPVIWKEKDRDPSVYLHRIAVNPLFKGGGIMNLIKDWAIDHAREKKKKYVRMDTWGNNIKLREYYISCGFNYIGQQYLEDVNDQPLHYGGSVLSLFQNEV